MRQRCYLFLPLLFLFAQGVILGQTGTGSLTGTVTDPSGAVVSGVTISAKNVATGLEVSTKSTPAGLYVIPNLPPGSYSVSASMQGFKQFRQTGVVIPVATAVDLDIHLTLGGTTQTVTVTGGAPLLQTSSSEVGSVVPNELIASLPLEVSGTIRNPVQFISLVPGFEGSVANNPGSNNTDDYKLSGGQITGADILVDGVSISLVSPNTQENKGISPEAVDEFKTLQNNFPAQYGFTGDAIISLTMKSGTNRLHGSVYDYFRNAALDANSWVNNTAGQPKSQDTQNDFGFSIGGPVEIPRIYNGHDRTFFFGDYEGFRFHTGGTSVATFPTEAERQGDFSFELPAIQLYDPTTHLPIPGNVLTNDPNFKPSSVITKLFNLLPPTNSSPSNNTFVNSRSFTTANLWDVKIDHAISDKQRISSSFDYDNTNTGVTESIGPFFGQETPQNTRYARFAHYYVFTPNVFNQFLAGFTRRWRGELSNSIGGNYPQKLGLVGVQNTTFPCFNFQGSPVGQVLSNCGDSQFADNTFTLADAVSWIHGRHNVMFGGQSLLMQFNVRRLTSSSGNFTFAPNETGLPSVANTGDAVASALFGLVHQSLLNYGAFSGVRYKNNAIYAQDSFRVRPHLTLNYGLRYDLDIPATEAFNRFSDVDPTLANPGAGNIPGAYTYFGAGPGRNGRKRPQDVYAKDFAPRVGFAYGINDKTVIRGGYGIYYEPLKEGSFADQDSLGFFNQETLQVGNGAPYLIDNGVPHTIPPTGPLTPQGQNGNSGVILVPPDVKPGQIQNWNLDVQRQISKNLLVSVAYVGSKGTYLPALNIIPNQVNPSYLSLGDELTMNVSCLTAGTCPTAIAAGIHSPYAGFSGTLAQALRPFPQYGDFNMEDNSFTPDRTGSSIYHAMQASVTKRLSEGLSFLVSYTISKDITTAESMGPGVGGFIAANSYIGQNSYNRAAEKAVSELDTPQALTYSFVYQLPLGSGRRFANHLGGADRLVKGWYVAGIGSYASGTPTEVYTSCGGTAEQILFAGCEFTGLARVDVIPGMSQTNKSSNFQPATTPFYNLNAFALPASFTFGDEGRTLPHARSFASMNEDFTLGKKTYLYGERVSVDFRAEFFNIFNRHIYQPPGGFAAPFGTPFQPAGSPGCPGPFACGFGAVTSASGPRNIQFGLRITY